MRSTTGVTFLAGDHQDTTQLSINANDLTQIARRRYTPFGQDRGTPTGPWPYEMTKGFVGDTKDSTDLTHLGAREYDPDTGRFISVDPILDTADPQSWNGYTYADNNPTTNSDPDGQWCRKFHGELECSNGDGQKRAPNKNGNGYHLGNDYSGDSGSSDGGSGGGGSSRVVKIVKPAANFLSGFGLGFMAATTPLGPVMMFTGIDEWALEMGGLDPASQAFRLGALAFDAIAFAAGGAGLAKGAAKLIAGRAAGQAMKAAGGRGASQALKAAGGRAAGGTRDLAKTCSNSFIANTKVSMADGSNKNIEDVRVGDKLVATDPETGNTRPQVVLAKITGFGKKGLVDISVVAGAGDAQKSGVIVTTDGHPFWVAGKVQKWIPASGLAPGMWLRTSAGAYVQVSAVHVRFPVLASAYNLTVSGFHSYYVVAGDTPVLVHNTGGPGSCVTGQAGEVAAGITKNTQAIIANGRTRVPDELNGTTLGEVKNVKYQYLSTQIKDYLSYAQQNGLQFNLYVRGSTRLSGPLQGLVDSGDINLIRNLP